MAWQIELTATARKTSSKLDPSTARRITLYLRERTATAEDPRDYATILKGDWREYWRFRVRDYRLICDIDGDVLRVFAVRIEPADQRFGRAAESNTYGSRGGC